jgi:hypothetical protein
MQCPSGRYLFAVGVPEIKHLKILQQTTEFLGLLPSNGLKRIITSPPEANRMPSLSCEPPSTHAAKDIQGAAIGLGKIALF